MSLEITRRLIFGGLGALVSIIPLAKPKFTHGAGGQPAPEPKPMPRPRLPVSVRVDLLFADGTVLAFSQAMATDLGDYVGKFVRQHCFMHRKGAWTVFFRPDADGRRVELVVEYGIWPTPDGIIPSHIRQSFKARIWQGDHALAEITIPKQYWMTRWRWQSASRPIRRTLADLVAMRAHLPMSEQALVGKVASFSSKSAIWTGPMESGGLMTGMPSAGDRQEIGPITNLQASYLMRDNKEAETGMLAQAEAVGSFPIWLRDTRTNNLLDVFVHPYQGFNSTAAPSEYPKIYPDVPRLDTRKVEPDFFTMNLAHLPSPSFIPWLLTDDPYFLEGAQATAVYAAIESNYHQLNQKLPGLANVTAPRAWAWGLRDVLRMAAFAPENPPLWLQPRSFFRKMSDNNLTYAKRLMTSTIKVFSIFHLATENNAALCPWMEGYLISVLGWAGWSGFFPEWNNAIAWLGEPLLRMTDDPALGGWDRRWPAAYYVPVNRARSLVKDRTIPWTSVSLSTVSDPYSSETPDSWGELWSLFKDWMAQQRKPIMIGTDNEIYEQPADNRVSCPSGPHYHEVVTGAVAALALSGVPKAREHFDWLHAKMPGIYASYKGGTRSFRYAYWPK